MGRRRLHLLPRPWGQQLPLLVVLPKVARLGRQQRRQQQQGQAGRQHSEVRRVVGVCDGMEGPSIPEWAAGTVSALTCTIAMLCFSCGIKTD